MSGDSPSRLRLVLSGALTTALLDGGLAMFSGADDLSFLLGSMAATLLVGLPLFAAIGWAPRLSPKTRAATIAFVVVAATIAHALQPAAELPGANTARWVAACTLAALGAAWIHRAGLARNLELLAPAVMAWTLAATWVFFLDAIESLAAAAWLAGVVLLVRAIGMRPVRYGTPGLIVAVVLLGSAIWPAARPVARFELQSPRAESVVSAPRRILLITVDTLRADRVSAIHDGRTRTPHMDALATDGVLFSQARSAAPWTLPATASIMTGLSPEVLGLSRHGSQVPDTTPLARRLRDAGFVTAALGSNPVLRAEAGLARGFSEYHFYPLPAFKGRSFGTHLLQEWRPERFGLRTRSTAELTDDALSWIELHRERDFFLWLHYLDPHAPYAPPEERLRGKTPAPRIGTHFDDPQAIRNGNFSVTTQEREWLRTLYDEEVEHVDDNIGRLLDKMREMNLYDDALIVLTSDHGEEFWEHDGFEHGHSLHDEVLRVPLIVKPVVAAARPRVDTPVSTQALFATILETCRLDVPQYATPALTPLWDSETPSARPPIVGSSMLYGDDRISVFYDGHKYIRNLVTGAESLFDIGVDEQELRPRTDLPEAVAAARQRVVEHINGARQLRESLELSDSPAATIDPQTLELLRSLGYTN